MVDIQHLSSTKSKMASRMHVLGTYETNLTTKFVADLSLQIFLIH